MLCGIPKAMAPRARRCAGMREPEERWQAFSFRDPRRTTMPLILWLLGVPLIVVIVLMFTGVV
jgi:hypothetical protein